MKPGLHFVLSGLLWLSVLLLAPGALPGGVHGDDDEEDVLDLYFPELDAVKEHLQELRLDEAKEAYEQARKELKDERRDKDVQTALAVVKRQISALEEFLKAKNYVEKGKLPRALKSLNKVLRNYGKIPFAKEAERLHAHPKGKVFYMINDFENENSREPDNFSTSRTGATAEVVSDVQLSSDGRHALKVHFDPRRPGLQMDDPGAYRCVALRTPDGFATDIGRFKAIAVSIVTPRKVRDMVTVDVFGGTSSCYAEHPGLSLNFTGRKDFVLRLNMFKFHGGFRWNDADNVRFSTLGPEGMDFIVDDVKLLR